MQEKLKAEVLLAYRELCRHGLDNHAGGIVSAIDRESGLIVMKSASEAFVVDLQGNVVEGYHTPSADIHTHIAIYQPFPNWAASSSPAQALPRFLRRRECISRCSAPCITPFSTMRSPVSPPLLRSGALSKSSPSTH